MRLALGLARGDAFATIDEHWVQLVGSRLAAWCRPESLRSGRLVVSTSVPAVAEQLRWQARDLVTAVQDLCADAGVVERVEVRVRPDVGGSAPLGEDPDTDTR